MYVKWMINIEICSFLRCLGTRAVLKAVQIEEYVVLKRLAALESASKSEDCSKSSDNIPLICLLITTRPIAHSGVCVCIRVCVDKFNMDPGHPLVTSSRM